MCIRDSTYITVEADQTAESYTTGLQQKYILIMGVSGGYILLYLVAWVVIWFWKKREEGKEDLIWEHRQNFAFFHLLIAVSVDRMLWEWMLLRKGLNNQSFCKETDTLE